MNKVIVEENGNYIGFVCEGNMDADNATVHTVGMLASVEECDAWLDDAIARRAWETKSELPDLFRTPLHDTTK